ncbi:MAG: hypothetical protein ACPLTR_03960 [Thermacetogeniaceae bacterium]
MIDWGSEKGWSRHQHFGLRRLWLDLYFAERREWRRHSSLGNRQVESLQVWLKTTGIEDREGELTPLGEQFAVRGTACLPLWELVWVNVVFNFPTGRWYAHLGRGEWTTTELKLLLRQTVPRLADWTVSNAVMELVGFLEQTPVGSELAQGAVVGRRPRRIVRRGWEPSDAAIVHALGRLYLQQGRTLLLWEEKLTWPWVVFGCRREIVLERLVFMEQNCFEVGEKGITIRIEDKEWWQCGVTAISLL